VLYVGVPATALLWLRDVAHGDRLVLWLFIVVWATDIGAYAVGRLVGGPRLAPRLSPHKTWAGLGGGIAAAAAAGAAAARGFASADAAILTVLSAVLAVVAQIGDLVESAVKRHFKVKDMSSLIPGHGGLFDRVDGLLAAAPAVALVQLIWGGSVLAWR
jgi:phosphatidate cytidylyltransferase